MLIIYEKCVIACSGCEDSHRLANSLSEDDACTVIETFRRRHTKCGHQGRLPIPKEEEGEE